MAVGLPQVPFNIDLVQSVTLWCPFFTISRRIIAFLGSGFDSGADSLINHLPAGTLLDLKLSPREAADEYF